MGGFLFAGLIVVVLAVIASLFIQMPGLQLALSAAIILLMSGYILFDTSRIIHGGETNYIMATVGLYVNIYNIFVNLLHLIMAFSGDD
jgi:modulator of FtsH protease